jgi:CubicO group peptidase (beta-lactamase class C family)
MEDVVQPEYRGRIASVSKPITATAIMKLVESGQLSLDARVFPDLLADMWNQVGTDVGDNRLADITVRHLLRHQGGWDRQRAGDPPFQLAAIAAGEGVSLPPGTDAMIRWVLRKPLQVTPGTVPYYSNFGYVVLARVIEQVTGQSYGAYVRSLLQQSGAEGFEIGGNRLSQLAADELRYFAQGVEGTLVPAIDGGDSGPVPVQYGGFDLAVLDGAGGWIASVIDLVRFGSLVDGENGIPDVLSAGTLEQMRHGAVSLSGGQYGFGWFVSGQALHHTGRLPGSASRMVILPGGTIYAAILNSSQPDEVTFLTDFVTTLEGAVAGVANWPAHDLFAEY